MNRIERIDHVLEFMETKYSNDIRPRRIREDLWPSMIAITEGADHHRPFGYSIPQYLSYDEAWVFFFCPELVADSSSELEDAEFDEWLRYIRAHVSVHTQLGSYCDESDVDETVLRAMPEMRPLIARVYEALFVF